MGDGLDIKLSRVLKHGDYDVIHDGNPYQPVEMTRDFDHCSFRSKFCGLLRCSSGVFDTWRVHKHSQASLITDDGYDVGLIMRIGVGCVPICKGVYMYIYTYSVYF